MSKNFKIVSVIVQCDKQYCPSRVYVVYKRQFFFLWPDVGIFSTRDLAEGFILDQLLDMKVK